MLAIFESQLSTIDSELLTLQSRLAELKKVKKDLETKQAKASEALDNLKALTSDLAGEAIDNLKAAVLAIFPSPTNENSNSAPSAPQSEFMVEVPKTEPEAVPPGSLITIGTGDGGSISWVVPEEKPFVELVNLNDTLAYQRKRDGEIVCAYLGCSSQKLAKEWADTLELKGHRCEVRKAKRLMGDCKYEVKIWNIAIDQLQKLAQQHPTAYSPVPQPPKPESPAPTPPSNDSIGTGESLAATGNDANSSEGEATKESSFLFYEPSDYDALTPEWNAYTNNDGKPGQLLGKVREHLTRDNAYQHSQLRGIEWNQCYFATREDAAADLLKRKQSADALHDKTNAQLRAAAGF